MNKILFFFLGERSSGEINITLNNLKGTKLIQNVDFVANKKNSLLFGSSSLDVIYHDEIKKTNEETLSFIESYCQKYNFIIFGDLNCFFLEKNITSKFQKLFFSMCDSLIQKKKYISFIDYFDCFCSDFDEYKTRYNNGVLELREKTKGVSLKTRLGYYINRFVPQRMQIQLIDLQKKYKVFAPVPFHNFDGTKETLFINKYEYVAHSIKEEKDRIIIILSSCILYSIKETVIKALIKNVLLKLIQTFSFKEIICIDPTSIIKEDIIFDYKKLKVVRFIEPEELHKEIDSSLFTCGFNTLSAFGCNSMSSGTPYISFYSSKSSNESIVFREFVEIDEFPGFNTFGLWEDCVYYKSLIDNNEYFNMVFKVDLSQENSFCKLQDYIKGNMFTESRIRFRKKISEQKIPTFDKCIENWVKGCNEKK